MRTTCDHCRESADYYYFNQFYGLTDEAEVYRRGLDFLKRFADRSNSIEPIYTQVRYVDQRGVEVKLPLPVKQMLAVVATAATRQQVTQAPFFTAVRTLEAHQVYMSPLGPTMTAAIPVYQPGEGNQAPTLAASAHHLSAAGVPTYQRGDHAVVWILTSPCLGLR